MLTNSDTETAAVVSQGRGEGPLVLRKIVSQRLCSEPPSRQCCSHPILTFNICGPLTHNNLYLTHYTLKKAKFHFCLLSRWANNKENILKMTKKYFYIFTIITNYTPSLVIAKWMNNEDQKMRVPLEAVIFSAVPWDTGFPWDGSQFHYLSRDWDATEKKQI